MAGRGRRGGPRREDDDGDRGDRERERRREYEREREEPYDDPQEHFRIEKRRFEGGLPPTPELYARAREQWYRLPGAVVRPSMNPGVGDPSSGEPQSPEKAGPTGNGPKQ
jgi:hypothetical protein